jgi:hypothetical protein
MSETPEKDSSAKERREMYAEIAALVGALAKTFAIKEAAAAEAVESGTMTLDFVSDANGNRFVAATFEGQTARVYQGAIKRDETPI